MAITVFSKAENLSSNAQNFNQTARDMIAELRGRKCSVQNLENSHLKILQTFDSAMSEIQKLKTEIQSKTTQGNEDQMFGLIARVTETETQVLEQLNQLNDTVLTYCPTAKINYGAPCIGPKIAPKIDTSNAKIRETISCASSIREIRGDGNCFISAFTTRILENLSEKKEIEKLIHFIAQDGIDTPNLKEELIDTLLYLQEYPSQIESVLRNNHKILPFINYFRQVTANEMKKNKNDFEVFFLSEIEQVYGESIGGQSYEALVDKFVSSMGVDFSHPMIIALCRKLDFPIQIIDPKIGAENGLNVLDRPHSNGTFCHLDNHYFVFYTAQEAPSVVAPSQSVVQSTGLTIKCNIPFGHTLFIRGNGNGLSWEKEGGVPLIHIEGDNWMFFSEEPLEDMDYKLLFDNVIWQEGGNFSIVKGKPVQEPRPQFNLPPAANLEVPDAPAAPVQATRITIRYDAGLGNKLFICGNAPGTSWEKKTELRNIGPDLWVFETSANFQTFEYKILLNEKWENGENHRTDCGKQEEFTPDFN